MSWFTAQPAPDSGSEPQSVRDAWDRRLAQQAEAEAEEAEAG